MPTDNGVLANKWARFAIRPAPTTGALNPAWLDLANTASFESAAETNTDTFDSIESDPVTFGGSTSRTITISSAVRPGHPAFDFITASARTGVAVEMRVRPDGARGRLGYTVLGTLTEGSHRIASGGGAQTYEGWRFLPSADRVAEPAAGGQEVGTII